jgi:hypothetical protein
MRGPRCFETYKLTVTTLVDGIENNLLDVSLELEQQASHQTPNISNRGWHRVQKDVARCNSNHQTRSMHSIAQSGAAHAAFTLLYILVQFESSHERGLKMKVLTHAFN